MMSAGKKFWRVTLWGTRDLKKRSSGTENALRKTLKRKRQIYLITGRYWYIQRGYRYGCITTHAIIILYDSMHRCRGLQSYSIVLLSRMHQKMQEKVKYNLNKIATHEKRVIFLLSTPWKPWASTNKVVRCVHRRRDFLRQLPLAHCWRTDHLLDVWVKG